LVHEFGKARQESRSLWTGYDDREDAAGGANRAPRAPEDKQEQTACDRQSRRRALPQKKMSGTLWIVYAAGRTTIRIVPDTFLGKAAPQLSWRCRVDLNPHDTG